jgi:hypothetical protein
MADPKRKKARPERPVVMDGRGARGTRAHETKHVGPDGPPATNRSIAQRIAPAGGHRRKKPRMPE